MNILSIFNLFESQTRYTIRTFLTRIKVHVIFQNISNFIIYYYFFNKGFLLLLYDIDKKYIKIFWKELK